MTVRRPIVDDETLGMAASLAAAISLLERSPKTGAPSDKMFDMMVSDYKRSLEAWRTLQHERK